MVRVSVAAGQAPGTSVVSVNTISPLKLGAGVIVTVSGFAV